MVQLHTCTVPDQCRRGVDPLCEHCHVTVILTTQRGWKVLEGQALFDRMAEPAALPTSSIVQLLDRVTLDTTTAIPPEEMLLLRGAVLATLDEVDVETLSSKLAERITFGLDKKLNPVILRAITAYNSVWSDMCTTVSGFVKGTDDLEYDSWMQKLAILYRTCEPQMTCCLTYANADPVYGDKPAQLIRKAAATALLEDTYVGAGGTALTDD